MVAEAARGVVVLAVDVVADRAADRDLPGAGQRPETHSPYGSAALMRASRLTPASTVDRTAASGSMEWIRLRAGHVDDEPAAVLGDVAVAAAEPAGEDAGGPGRRPGRRRRRRTRHRVVAPHRPASVRCDPNR